ncbi:polymer-forming cytoskeletal protein [Paenibacillus sp.]|jgi:cytoskeletal protein CcmA (bactofilin family)|uniref:bactofilin family protein n=1 Tax=Paenibacillus sp. TaxID=58172 RepID=UPI00281B3D0D|nr:polymer-forming cytoskeletal protein [Paenibacillus sp.]MDR0268326.1 polymer-forming cytoskeletal protein [Paenibacillus sp.]
MLIRSKTKNSFMSTDSLIGRGTEVEGALACEANVRIEGKFNGVIESRACVTIGEFAVARSDISAREVIIAGKVYGDVQAEGKLTITSTGKMFGNVLAASSLVIAEGGILNGSSNMEPKEEQQDTMPTNDVQLLETEAG